VAETTEKYQDAGPKVRPGQKEEMVYTWPYLVSIEALMAIAMTLALTIMSMFVNAPLLDLANGEETPNPAKAPWYFLGLQELLLHMHPALAGVIVPTAVIILLAMIPYVDRDRRGTGIWFSTKKGVPIFMFAAVYTLVWEIALIFIDHFWVIAPGKHGIEPFLTATLVNLTGWGTDKVDWVGKIFVPSVLMIFIPWALAIIVKRRWNANTREIMIALYSFFITSFLLLTIVGTFFRGHSMELVWPWEVPHPPCSSTTPCPQFENH
jgi:menaquinol-cytochrome c reductase cytochrome b/c subunit